MLLVHLYLSLYNLFFCVISRAISRVKIPQNYSHLCYIDYTYHRRQLDLLFLAVTELFSHSQQESLNISESKVYNTNIGKKMV